MSVATSLTAATTFGDSRLPPRFWAKVRIGATPAHRPDLGPCWQWTASRFSNGYGKFWAGSRVALAHRVAYETLIGPIPVGLESDHLCRVHPCVRPSHVEPVTRGENLRRSPLMGRDTKGEANGRHKLSEDDVRAIRMLRGKLSQSVLAKRFGVDQRHISNVQCRRKWRHV